VHFPRRADSIPMPSSTAEGRRSESNRRIADLQTSALARSRWLSLAISGTCAAETGCAKGFDRDRLSFVLVIRATALHFAEQIAHGGSGRRTYATEPATATSLAGYINRYSLGSRLQVESRTARSGS
jgi:hypothetical protein